MNSYIKKMRFVDDNGEQYPEWEQKKLGEVAELYQPQTISGKDLLPEGYPVYGANGRIGYYSKYNHDTEQVTVTCRGNTCGTMNYTVAYSWITGNAMVINPIVGKATKQYLYHCLTSIDFDFIITGSGQPQITRGPLAEVKIPLPSLPEQEKIAEFFSALDERIESTASKVVLLKQQKQGYLQQVFNRELVFTDDNGEQYPEWEQKKLEEVASVTSGKRLPKGHQFTSSGTPYITVSDMGDKRVDHKRFSFISPATETVLQRYKVTKGDVIISIAGTLGKVNLIDASLEQANLTENCDKIRVNERIMPEFIYYVLKSSSIQSDIEKTSTTSSQPKLALEQLRNFSIPTPSLSEQRKIAEFFSVLDERIELNENKLALLKEQKKGYLQGIFG